MDTKQKRCLGFTLIETLIYLALFGMLFSGAVVCAYSVLESSGRNQSKAMLQGDGNFIAAKIEWALSQATSITVPAGGDLQLATPTGTLEFKPDATNTGLLLARNGSAGTLLNNSNETIKDLSFVKIDASGDRPEGINYKFTLITLTPNGVPISTDFSSTVYLRN